MIQILPVVLFTAGLGFIVYSGFEINKVLGLALLGIALLGMSYIISPNQE
jgi:hypothetical protein